MVKPSSDTLHPNSGARFAMTRIETGNSETAPAALVYTVDVFVSGGETLQGKLAQDERGSWALVGIPEQHWAFDETLKLARVLKKNPVGSMLRWRPGPG